MHPGGKMRSLTLVLLMVTVAVAIPLDLAARTDPLEHPATTKVLEMITAGQTDEEILDQIDELAPFPEFNGHDLAELKRRGVSDRVLLRMLEMTGNGAAARPTSVTTPRETSPELAPEARGGLIRVLVDCPFDVNYLEVALNGEIQSTRGELWKGSVGTGEHLDPPPDVADQELAVLFESPVAPGRHIAAVGFAVTEVRQDPSEVWGQEAGEHYETRGIRAIPSVLPGQAPIGNVVALCDIWAGQLCEVVATRQYTSSTLLRGASVYNVRYRVSVVDRR
jgi:hypothetical protein